jgi:gas vesicle protein
MFVLGMGAGVAAGVGLAMLFAPASGDKLRKEAQDYYEQLLAEARKAAEERRKALEIELSDLTSGKKV